MTHQLEHDEDEEVCVVDCGEVKWLAAIYTVPGRGVRRPCAAHPSRPLPLPSAYVFRGYIVVLHKLFSFYRQSGFTLITKKHIPGSCLQLLMFIICIYNYPFFIFLFMLYSIYKQPVHRDT